MSFPVYSAYKDSGVPWLGEVPGHWEVVQTKRQFARRKQVNTGMLCEDRLALTMNGVVPRSLDDLDGLQSSDYEGYQIFEPGDLAFKLIDLQNVKTSRVGMVPSRGIMSPAYVRLKPSKQITGQFGYWYFMALYWLQVFNNLGGGVRQTLGPEELLTVPFPLPTEAEQAAIAAFLDRETAKIDALVAEQERLIALLKEKRQAVISHAVTKGLNPHAPLSDSGIEWLGEIPAHWDVRKLKGLTSRIGDGLHGTPEYDDNGPCFFINGTNLYEGWVRITEATRSVSASTADAHQIDLDDTTVLMSINGTIGNLALYRGESVILGKSAAYINCEEEIDRWYLFYVLQSDAAKRFFHSTIANTTIHNLSLDAIRSLRIGLPILTEQTSITEVLSEASVQMNKAIDEVGKVITLLQERRAAIISAAVTGKIDVRGLVDTPAELEVA